MSKPTIGCFLQANSNRQQFLLEAVKSLNLPIFNKRLIYLYGNNPLYQEVGSELSNALWESSFNSLDRMSSFHKAINQLDTDYIFYTEDDIALQSLPPEIFTILEREDCGMLSLNLGGSLCDYPHNYGDLILDASRIVLRTSDFTIFERDYQLRNNFFFEFPCVFIRKEMLREFNYTSTNSIEMALSNEYHRVSLKYKKFSICKTDFLNNLSSNTITDFRYEMENSKFYKLLDPMQGGVEWTLEKLK